MILSSFSFSCQKDIKLDNDNFIIADNIYFIRNPDSKEKYHCNSFPPYYQGVTWREKFGDREIQVNVANQASNNRGSLSDFHGYISYIQRKGQDSVQYYGKFSQFKIQFNQNNKAFISFKDMVIYRYYDNNLLNLNKSDLKIVSGKVTFE